MIYLYRKTHGRWNKIDEFDSLRALGKECGFTVRKIAELILPLKSFKTIQWTDGGGQEYKMEKKDGKV